MAATGSPRSCLAARRSRYSPIPRSRYWSIDEPCVGSIGSTEPTAGPRHVRTEFFGRAALFPRGVPLFSICKGGTDLNSQCHSYNGSRTRSLCVHGREEHLTGRPSCGHRQSMLVRHDYVRPHSSHRPSLGKTLAPSSTACSIARGMAPDVSSCPSARSQTGNRRPETPPIPHQDMTARNVTQ